MIDSGDIEFDYGIDFGRLDKKLQDQILRLKIDRIVKCVQDHRTITHVIFAQRLDSRELVVYRFSFYTCEFLGVESYGCYSERLGWS